MLFSKKRKLQIFAMGAMLLFCAGGASAAAIKISFITPGGGEVFVPGQQYTLQVYSQLTYKSITLELSLDQGKTFASLGTIDNTSKIGVYRNRFVWTVPATVSASCVIRATGIRHKSISNLSGVFSIGNGNSLTGTAPLAPGAIGTSLLADGSVTNPKLAPNAVTSDKIGSGQSSSNFVLIADGKGGTNFIDPNLLGITAISGNAATATNAINFSGNLSGDVTGTQSATVVSKLQGTALLATPPLNGQVLQFNGTQWAPANNGAGTFVLKAGDAMTGFLTLNADPTANLQAATKQYVDAETIRATAVESTKVNRAGDTLTGFLTLNADPTANLQAATKQYVDAETTRATAAEATKVNRSGGDTMQTAGNNVGLTIQGSGVTQVKNLQEWNNGAAALASVNPGGTFTSGALTTAGALIINDGGGATAKTIMIAPAGTLPGAAPANITYSLPNTKTANDTFAMLSDIPASLSPSFADFFALMPNDNAAPIAPGTPIQFPQNGPANNISRLNVSQFLLPAIGTYQVNFQVSITEAGQLVICLNGAELPQTVVGRATGTSQIVGTCLVSTVTVNTILEVRNPAGESTALTITPNAGGTDPVSAHLVITRLQ